jgi:hypothetical protein
MSYRGCESVAEDMKVRWPIEAMRVSVLAVRVPGCVIELIEDRGFLLKYCIASKCPNLKVTK